MINYTGQNNTFVKKVIDYKGEAIMSEEDKRLFDLNPTYILTFNDKCKIDEKELNLIAQQLTEIGRESIWRDPIHGREFT